MRINQEISREVPAKVENTKDEPDVAETTPEEDPVLKEMDERFEQNTTPIKETDTK